MNVLRVVDIVRRMEQGLTRPFLVRTEDEALYVAKGRATTQRGQCAEWLCAHLGQALGLPMPSFSLLDVSQALVSAFGPDAEDLGAGIVFGSLLQQPVQDLVLPQVVGVDAELRRRVLAFDWWVENADRSLTERGGNPNLLWCAAEPRLLVIDHNLAFDAAFDVTRFFETHVFRFDADALFGDWVNRADMQQRLCAALPAFDTACASFPESWKWIDSERTLPLGIDWYAYRTRLAQRLELTRGGPP